MDHVSDNYYTKTVKSYMSYYDDCDNYNNKQLSNICYMDHDCLLKKRNERTNNFFITVYVWKSIIIYFQISPLIIESNISAAPTSDAYIAL